MLKKKWYWLQALKSIVYNVTKAFYFRKVFDIWIDLFIRESWKICLTLLIIIIIMIIINNKYLFAANQLICMILEWF